MYSIYCNCFFHVFIFISWHRQSPLVHFSASRGRHFREHAHTYPGSQRGSDRSIQAPIFSCHRRGEFTMRRTCARTHLVYLFCRRKEMKGHVVTTLDNSKNFLALWTASVVQSSFYACPCHIGAKHSPLLHAEGLFIMNICLYVRTVLTDEHLYPTGSQISLRSLTCF